MLLEDRPWSNHESKYRSPGLNSAALAVALGFPGGSEVKVSAWNAGDLGSIPASGRSPGEGKGNPLQYSCLENPMEGGAWWATVHGVAKSRTRLSDYIHPSSIIISRSIDVAAKGIISLFYG